MPAKGFSGQANGLLDPETHVQRQLDGTIMFVEFVSCFSSFCRRKLKMWVVLIPRTEHRFNAMGMRVFENENT